jgi:RHS repeat-associated protein
MRILPSLAAVLPTLALNAAPSVAVPARPPSCPAGFEEVELEQSSGTFSVTEDLLTRGSVCRPLAAAAAQPVVQTPPSPAAAEGIEGHRASSALPPAAVALTMNPPRPMPAGVSSRFIARTYDDFDRIETETVPLEDGGTATISYSYYPDGLCRSLTDAFGRVTFYEYDGRARLSRVTANQGLPDEHITSYGYWPDSLLKTITKPDGTVTSYGYDRGDRLTSIVVRRGADVLTSYEYSYDVNGNRLTQVETNGGPPETTTYTYDDLSRLETVTYPDDTSAAYEYDAVGNRTRETLRDASGVVVSDKTAVFDPINRLSSITDSVDPSQNATLTYDRNGNLLSKTTAAGTEEYSYDARDLLVETRAGPAITARFAYDAFGRRYLKIGLEGIRQYLYDETSTLHELDENDLEVAKYEYGGDRLESFIRRDEARRFHHQDALGSVVALTDSGGAVVARYHLDAWGRYRVPSELDASRNRFGFTGYLFDQETDLYYAKARFYDPEIGRFTTQDSFLGDVSEPPSLHRYVYGANRPTFFVDPTGHELFPASCYAGQGCGPSAPTVTDRLLAEGVRGVASLLWDKARGAHNFAVNTFGSIVYDLGQRTGWGGESFESQYEATAGAVVPSRERLPRMTPAETLYLLYESNLESKQRYDEAFERGDIKAAQAEAIPFLSQFVAARSASSALTGAPPVLAVTAEGATLSLGGDVAVNRGGLGVLMMGSAGRSGSPTGTVQEPDSAVAGSHSTEAGEGSPELMPRAERLQPGRTPLREFDIDLYKTFSGPRSGDQLAGHEMLQNAWLKAHGHADRRGVGAFSRNNPAVALSDQMHTRVGVEQVKLGLNDAARLRGMGAAENIDLNAQAMRNAGVPEHIVQTLQEEAMKHATTLPR